MGVFDFLFGRKKKKVTYSKDSSVYDIDPIDIDPKERSELFHEKHRNNIGNVDIDVPKIAAEPLSPEELSFLRYADKKQPVGIAGYWTHEVNLNIKDTLEKLIAMDYLSYGIDPSSMAMNELKNILREKNLKISGKKQELIDRIESNFSKDELEKYRFKKSLLLTGNGKNALRDVPLSITYNHLFDKKIIDFILDRNFIEAYRQVSIYESNKPAKRGINIDWNRRAKNPENYISPKIQAYDEILQENLRFDYRDSENLAAVLIFADMLGMNISGIPKKTLRSLAPFVHQKVTSLKDENEINIAAIRKVIYILNKHTTLNELHVFKNMGTSKYEILSAEDGNECITCKKMNGKVFEISSAVIGKNAPPLCESCRCTIIPYTE